MTLQNAVTQYIAWRQAHGSKFGTETAMLRLFMKHVGDKANSDSVTEGQILDFLEGDRPLTRYRAAKYTVLNGFYLYGTSRSLATRSPLPPRVSEPKSPKSAPPYVYTHDELCKLFNSIDRSCIGAPQLDAGTFRMLLLFLYGAGLRLGEAIRLSLTDVDLSSAVLAVHASKFYKSRLVPIGPKLAGATRDYATVRRTRPTPGGRNASFLSNRDGTPLARSTVHKTFARLLRAARIERKLDGRQSPCLHSFRHSFAVHRLTAWYRQGADVQRLLPVLSTYLGHANLAGTQVYLSMTPELLQQASLRLQRFVEGEANE